MAKYRQFHVRFWKDPDVELLEPIEKLIFAYLFTNEACTESGIYPVTLKTISNETGIPIDDVQNRFETGIKNVIYDWDNNIVFVVRFLEHNGGGRPDLLLAAIRKECKTTITNLWNDFIAYYPDFAEELSDQIKQLANSLQTVGKPFNRNRNSNRNSNSNRKGKKESKQKENPPPPKIKPYMERVNDYFDSKDLEVCQPYWAAAYPNVDIPGELKKAKAWLISNPKKAKADFRKFCNNWLLGEMARISKRGGEPPETPARVMEKLQSVYGRIYKEAKEQQKKNPEFKFTDSSILAHMKNALGYKDDLLVQLIDELGGPGKLTGKFPSYEKYKKG